jgi:integrase
LAQRRGEQIAISGTVLAPRRWTKNPLLYLFRDRRHTSAMHLLQSGVPFNVIALWLGHESTTTTHRYVEADLAMKEKALARLEAPDTKMLRYRAPDSLMRFLQGL